MYQLLFHAGGKWELSRGQQQPLSEGFSGGTFDLKINK